LDLGGGLFDPQQGYQFEIIAAHNGILGSFESIFVPALANGLFWSIRYHTDTVVLEVIDSLRADFDNDHDVDGVDLSIFNTSFGKSNEADANGDGDTDGVDFLVWQRQFGAIRLAGNARQVAIPEPATLILLLVSVGFVGLGGYPPMHPRKSTTSWMLTTFA